MGRMLKQAVGDDSKELFSIMAELLSEHNGINILELQQELRNETSHRKAVEIQFAKTQEKLNAKHRAALEALQKELEMERAKPNEKVDKMKKQVEDIQKENQGLIQRNKELQEEKMVLIKQFDDSNARRHTAENLLA